MDHLVADQSHHIYIISGEKIVIGFVAVDAIPKEDTVKSIMENVLLMNDDISFIAAFQPSSK